MGGIIPPFPHSLYQLRGLGEGLIIPRRKQKDLVTKSYTQPRMWTDSL